MPGLALWVLARRPPDAAELYRRITFLLGGTVGAPRQPEAPPGPPAPPPGWPPAPPAPPPDWPPDLPVPPRLPGSIDTRFGPPPTPVTDAIRAAFPEEVWTPAAEIAYLESGWRPTAVNDTRPLAGGACGVRYLLPDGTPADTEYSIGLFQINVCVHGGSYAEWSNSYANSLKAVQLWQRAGRRWSPWWISAGRLGLPR